MNKKILERSINSRNEQAIKSLVNLDALREWGLNREITPIPTFEKPKKIKLSAGVVNLAKTLILSLKP